MEISQRDLKSRSGSVKCESRLHDDHLSCYDVCNMFDNFFSLDQSEIVNLVRDYLDSTVFIDYPEMRNVYIVTISGSVASGQYDQNSDIDLDFYCVDKPTVEKYQDNIRQIKKATSSDEKTPIQIHRLKSLTEVEKELSCYKNDTALRETQQSLIVLDQDDTFLALQDRFAQYPEEVATEKLNWLYAQMVFEYVEHFKIAAERGDEYFLQVSKINILRLGGNAILVANKNWPAFDKHLMRTLEDIKCDPDILKSAIQILSSIGLNTAPKVDEFMDLVENYLLSRNFIPKERAQYWIDLRPKYSVNFN